jgi:hypothetical protein
MLYVSPLTLSLIWIALDLSRYCLDLGSLHSSINVIMPYYTKDIILDALYDLPYRHRLVHDLFIAGE